MEDAVACMAGYEKLNEERPKLFQYGAKRGLKQGGWPGVPFKCSIQFQDGPDKHVSKKEDSSPHWNTKSDGDDSRLTSGEFRAICRGSAAGPPVDPLGLPLPPLVMDPRVTAALALHHFTKADFPDGPVTKLETRTGKEEPISHAENLSVGPEYVEQDHDFLGGGGRRRTPQVFSVTHYLGTTSK